MTADEASEKVMETMLQAEDPQAVLLMVVAGDAAGWRTVSVQWSGDDSAELAMLRALSGTVHEMLAPV